MNQTTFLDKCKGIALVFSAFGLLLFGAAVLVYSASPTQADNGPDTTYVTGKYMINFQAISADQTMNYYILVWNTETGYSKLYYGSDDVKLGVANTSYQLPSSPL